MQMYPQQPQYGAPQTYASPPPAAPSVLVPANTVNLENGQTSDDLNIPKNIKEIKGMV